MPKKIKEEVNNNRVHLLLVLAMASESLNVILALAVSGAQSNTCSPNLIPPLLSLSFGILSVVLLVIAIVKKRKISIVVPSVVLFTVIALLTPILLVISLGGILHCWNF